MSSPLISRTLPYELKTWWPWEFDWLYWLCNVQSDLEVNMRLHTNPASLLPMLPWPRLSGNSAPIKYNYHACSEEEGYISVAAYSFPRHPYTQIIPLRSHNLKKLENVCTRHSIYTLHISPWSHYSPHRWSTARPCKARTGSNGRVHRKKWWAALQGQDSVVHLKSRAAASAIFRPFGGCYSIIKYKGSIWLGGRKVCYEDRWYVSGYWLEISLLTRLQQVLWLLYGMVTSTLILLELVSVYRGVLFEWCWHCSSSGEQCCFVRYYAL